MTTLEVEGAYEVDVPAMPDKVLTYASRSLHLEERQGVEDKWERYMNALSYQLLLRAVQATSDDSMVPFHNPGLLTWGFEVQLNSFMSCTVHRMLSAHPGLLIESQRLHWTKERDPEIADHCCNVLLRLGSAHASS